jgi:hypothetical protein
LTPLPGFESGNKEFPDLEYAWVLTPPDVIGVFVSLVASWTL